MTLLRSVGEAAIILAIDAAIRKISHHEAVVAADHDDCLFLYVIDYSVYGEVVVVKNDLLHALVVILIIDCKVKDALECVLHGLEQVVRDD